MQFPLGRGFHNKLQPQATAAHCGRNGCTAGHHCDAQKKVHHCMKQDTQGHGYCLKINAERQHTQHKCKPALQYFMLDKPFTSHRSACLLHQRLDPFEFISLANQKKSTSPLTLTQITADPCVEIKNRSPCVEIKSRSLIIIVSKKKLQLSRRTMFLWFYRAILPLLMLVVLIWKTFWACLFKLPNPVMNA